MARMIKREKPIINDLKIPTGWKGWWRKVEKDARQVRKEKSRIFKKGGEEEHCNDQEGGMYIKNARWRCLK